MSPKSTFMSVAIVIIAVTVAARPSIAEPTKARSIAITVTESTLPPLDAPRRDPLPRHGHAATRAPGREHIDEYAGSGPNAHNELMPPERCPRQVGGALAMDCATPTDAERRDLAMWLACEKYRPHDFTDGGVGP